VRKTIVIVGIIMAFILGTLVSAPTVAAVQGEPFVFMQEEIDFINELIMELQAQFAPNVLLLHYEQSDLVQVPSTTQLPEQLIELAVWEIEKDTAFVYDIKSSTPLFDSSVFANIKGNVDIGWYKSSDTTFSTTGMSWNTIHDASASNFGFEVESDFIPQSSLSSQTNFIAFGAAYSGTEGDPGEVKDFTGTVTIHLLPGQSLNKICCPP